jgi:hypothetical protein
MSEARHTAVHTPAENRADLARVLLAIALLAWLSTWDQVRGSSAEPLTASIASPR